MVSHAPSHPELATIQSRLLVDYQRAVDRQPEQGSIPLSGWTARTTLRYDRQDGTIDFSDTTRSISRTRLGSGTRPAINDEEIMAQSFRASTKYCSEGLRLVVAAAAFKNTSSETLGFKSY